MRGTRVKFLRRQMTDNFKFNYSLSELKHWWTYGDLKQKLKEV